MVDFAASVDYLSVTFTWTPPSFLGVPPTLDPASIIYYVLDVRNDTDSVGGATVPHPTTTVVVNLTYPCEEYYATIFARNTRAGDGPETMNAFTLNETGALHYFLVSRLDDCNRISVIGNYQRVNVIVVKSSSSSDDCNEKAGVDISVLWPHKRKRLYNK